MPRPSPKGRAKYVFVTGGVTSSLGKGIVSSSLGKLLQSRGFDVTIQKFDPYINVDPGTLAPYEHGECFITDDGVETDLDLGHYERFLGIPIPGSNNVTAGRIYYDLISKERRGDFLGRTVQVIPHVTDEIKSHIYKLGDTGKHDIVITEIGGSVGDIESQPFLEAIRQVNMEVGTTSVSFVHLTLVPFLESSGELKTKPTQQSVKELLSLGIQPDVLICRCTKTLPKDIRKKIALHCNISLSRVIEARDADIIYDVPIAMMREKLDECVLSKLRISRKNAPEMSTWRAFLSRLKAPTHEIHIGLVGKYAQLKDAYRSIYESLIHAGVVNESSVQVSWIHAEKLEEGSVKKCLEEVDGILVAPGFGERGIKGKILAAKYAREKHIPFLGICLGMHCAVVEFAKHVLGLKEAHSSEFVPNNPHPVITLLNSQKNLKDKGGTMRLGAYPCHLVKKSKAHHAYKSSRISERHRHRYEFNNAYLKRFEKAGLKASGRSPDGKLVEIVELAAHPWFVGCQFHPEYKSTVEKAHPLFVSFVKAALKNKTQKELSESL